MNNGFVFTDACTLAAYAAFGGAGLSFGWNLLKSLVAKATDKI